MEAKKKNGADKWRSLDQPQLYTLKGYSAWVRHVRSALQREAEQAPEPEKPERDRPHR